MKRSRRTASSDDPRRRRTRRAPLILIVDDHADQRELYSSYLVSKGFRFVTAADGDTAVDIAVRVRPDLIVMDLSLPRVDGWEATRRLKRDSRTSDVPVLACTAHAFGGAVERALDAGCDSYVVKPCLPEDLLREIRRLLQAFAERRSPKQA